MASDAAARPMRALAWSAAQSWSTQAIRLIAVIVMARLLTPGEFGLYAFAAALMGGLQLLVGQGLGAAITQRPQLDDEHLSAALIRMLLGSTVLATAVLVGADLASRLLHQPQAASVLRVLTATFALNAAANVAQALLRRRLNLKATAVATIAAESVGAALGIVMAWRGYGVWSLVARQLCVSAVTALVAWLLLGTVRLPRPARRHFDEMAGPARRIAAGNALVLIRDRLDEVVIGGLLGVEALGLYALARRQVEALTALIPAVIQNAGWPLFAAQQADRAALGATLRQGQQGMATLAWPAYAAFAAAAPLWAPLVLGQQWAGAVPLIVGLSIIAAVRAVVGLQLIAMVASGEAGRRLMLEVLATAIVYLAMLLAAGHGVVAVVFAAAAATALLSPLELALIARTLPVDLRDLLGLLSRGAVLAAAVAAAVWVFVRWTGPLALAVPAVGAAAAMVYLGGVRLLFPGALGRLLARLRPAQAAGGG